MSSHQIDCPQSYEPDLPCTCKPLSEGESMEDRNAHLRWENTHTSNDGCYPRPTSHAPSCSASYEPDHPCTCGFGNQHPSTIPPTHNPRDRRVLFYIFPISKNRQLLPVVFYPQNALSPLMTLIRITIIAMTSRMCIKPPIVYEVTTPRSHRIPKTTAIVVNIILVSSKCCWPSNTFISESVSNIDYVVVSCV